MLSAGRQGCTSELPDWADLSLSAPVGSQSTKCGAALQRGGVVVAQSGGLPYAWYIRRGLQVAFRRVAPPAEGVILAALPPAEGVIFPMPCLLACLAQ